MLVEQQHNVNGDDATAGAAEDCLRIDQVLGQDNYDASIQLASCFTPESSEHSFQDVDSFNISVPTTLNAIQLSGLGIFGHTCDPPMSFRDRHRYLNGVYNSYSDPKIITAEAMGEVAQRVGLFMEEVLAWFKDEQLRRSELLANTRSDLPPLRTAQFPLSPDSTKASGESSTASSPIGCTSTQTPSQSSGASSPSPVSNGADNTMAPPKSKRGRPAKTQIKLESDLSGLDAKRKKTSIKYPCTDCGNYLSAERYAEHINRKHFPKNVWECPKINPVTGKLCSSAPGYRPCYRLDNFSTHLKGEHDCTATEVAELQTSCKFEVSDFYHKVCGFCHKDLKSRDESIEHIKDHFKESSQRPNPPVDLNVSLWKDNCGSDHVLRIGIHYKIIASTEMTDQHDHGNDHDHDDGADPHSDSDHSGKESKSGSFGRDHSMSTHEGSTAYDGSRPSNGGHFDDSQACDTSDNGSGDHEGHCTNTGEDTLDDKESSNTENSGSIEVHTHVTSTDVDTHTSNHMDVSDSIDKTSNRHLVAQISRDKGHSLTGNLSIKQESTAISDDCKMFRDFACQSTDCNYTTSDLLALEIHVGREHNEISLGGNVMSRYLETGVLDNALFQTKKEVSVTKTKTSDSSLPNNDKSHHRHFDFPFHSYQALAPFKSDHPYYGPYPGPSKYPSYTDSSPNLTSTEKSKSQRRFSTFSSVIGSPVVSMGVSSASSPPIGLLTPEWRSSGLGVSPSIVSYDEYSGNEYRSLYTANDYNGDSLAILRPPGFVDPSILHPSSTTDLSWSSSFPLSPYSPYLGPPSTSGISSMIYSESSEENKEKGRCTYPECGKVFKDLKAHMLTHANERPEKCPIQTCDYHIKGFARKYDKNRHTLTHYKGTMVCGFCPGSGSAAEKHFNRADVFKRHLTSVHQVEQTPPNSRKKLPTATKRNTSKKLSGYASDATGKCSTCSETFDNAQDFYDHLDDCVLRVVQQEEPSAAVNAMRLAEVEQDESVLDTLRKHSLPTITTQSLAEGEEGDFGDENDDDFTIWLKNRNGHGHRANRAQRSRGLTHSKGGVTLKSERKKRKDYPSSWQSAVSQLKTKKRTVCVLTPEKDIEYTRDTFIKLEPSEPYKRITLMTDK